MALVPAQLSFRILLEHIVELSTELEQILINHFQIITCHFRQSVSLGNQPAGTGQIYYEPDEADDIDDEDPDDDLDI